jgi:glycosyltransferase involved in cell wall biosynthesis
MKSLKVLVLGWHDEPAKVGGVGLVSQQIAKAVGTEVEVDFLAPEFAVQGQTVEGSYLGGLYPGYSGSATGEKGRKRPVLDWSRHTTKLSLDNPQHYDLIHAHDWASFPLAQKLSKDWSVPFVAHFHSTEQDRSPLLPDQAISRLEKRAQTNAGATIAVSGKTAKRLEGHGGDISVFHNQWGVQETEWAEREADGVKRVLFIGRVATQKGWDRYVEMSNEMLKANPNIAFWVVGEGPELRQMMELVKAQGLVRHFSFRPFVDRDGLGQLFAKIDLAVFPSRSEPFGMTVWDALRAGIPSLVSEGHGILELFPQVPACTFEHSSKSARQALALLDDPDFKEGFRAYCQKTIESLDTSGQVSRLVDIYHQLASLKP